MGVFLKTLIFLGIPLTSYGGNFLYIQQDIKTESHLVQLQDLLGKDASTHISEEKRKTVVLELKKTLATHIYKSSDIIKALNIHGLKNICNSSLGCHWKIPRQISIQNIGPLPSKKTVIYRLQKKWKEKCSDCTFYFKNLNLPKISSTTKNWNLITNSNIPRGSFSFQIKTGALNKGPVWGSGYVRVHKKLPVLRKNLMKGEVIRASDLIWKDRDVTYERGATPEVSQIKGKVARRDLFKDQVLKINQLIKPRLVKAGALVRVILESSHFQVSFVGKALQSGAEGDEVKVRNKSSRKIVSGVIGSDSTVRVR